MTEGRGAIHTVGLHTCYHCHHDATTVMIMFDTACCLVFPILSIFLLIDFVSNGDN